MKGSSQPGAVHSIEVEDVADTRASDISGDVAVRDQRLPAGTRVGEYVVEAQLGEGGFGAVYRGVHPVIGKAVAIKVLSARHSSDPRIVSRFVSEARATITIGHANIVDIFSFGQLPDGRPYYVMELLDGTNLYDRLQQRGRFSVEETIEILGQVAAALDAAHAAGIAHRDLKPENIFLVAGDQLRVKLLDFGVAKLLDDSVPRQHRTETGAALGTPSYMAPEQCMGRAVDHRADIYAFGVVAYEMLTGRLPFLGDSSFSVMLSHVNDTPTRPDVIVPELSAGVADAVSWMMEKDAERRPRTLAHAIAALRATSAGERFQGAGHGPTLPDRPSPLALPSKPAPVVPAHATSRWPIVAGLAGVAIVAVVGVVAFVRSRPATEPVTTAAITATPLAAPKTIKLALRGIAADATVVGPNGELLATGPGTIELAQGASRTSIVIKAPGRADQPLIVVPEHDLSIDLTPVPAVTEPTSGAARVAGTGDGAPADRRPAKGAGDRARPAQRVNELEPWE
ncbi:serine/threonine protein kinase [Myxococcota bacterium]|nr:serine/threonine protein kinase [Myxococcota bacterium]